MVTTTKRLSAGAIHLLDILEGLAKASARQGLDFAFPSRARLAGRMKCAERTVSRRVKELAQRGKVRVERAREVHGRNHYYLVTALSPAQVTVLAQAEGTALSAADVPAVSLAQVTEAAQAIETAPLVEVESVVREEEKQQQQPTAAAELTLAEKAEKALLALGVEQPMAGRLARDDAALALVVACHCRAVARKCRNPKIIPGMAVNCCRAPGECNFRRKDRAPRYGADGLIDPHSVWRLPDESPAHADLKDAEQRRQKAQAKRQQTAADRRANEAARTEKARQHAAWEALDEGEQRGIVAAVGAGHPELGKRPGIAHDLCLAMALRLQEAAADLAKWQALPEAERHAAEGLAAREWPLFFGGGRRLWACWMALEMLKKKK